MPSELRKVTADLLQQPAAAQGRDTPESSPALPRAHTCSVQEPLVYAVRQEAKQAVGPSHTSLQLLVRDGFI